MNIPITYGELRLEVNVYVQPAEPENGIMSPEIIIEEVHLPGTFCNKDGIKLDMGDIEDFIWDRLEKDQQFAMTIQELVEEAYDDLGRTMEDAA